MRVESKPDFKKRTGYSPDGADAAFLLIDLARNRHGLIALEPLKDAPDSQGMRRQVSMRDLQIQDRTSYSDLIYME
jgi:hypothetical protein